MKSLLPLFVLLPLLVHGVEQEQLAAMLATSATNQGAAYLASRNAITDNGSNVLAALAQAGCDATLSWQQRLAARISYERIVRSQDIDALRCYDWGKDPAFKKEWRNNIVGPIEGVRGLAIPEMVRYGLWYYYIELTWKNTGEVSTSKIPRLKGDWVRWCRMALAGQEEQGWLQLAMIERLKKDALLAESDSVELYQALCKSNADAVPILVERFDAYNKHEVKGPEIYTGANAITYRGMFEPILAVADTRHTILLEKFVKDHPVLTALEPKIAEVRARPTSAVKHEPSFRLGTNLVVVAP